MRPPGSDSWALAANVSLLFTELPYLERFAAAAAAGFGEVETWWPFATATALPADVEALVDAVAAAGVPLTGLNLFAGDLSAGERGIVSAFGRERELAANLEVVASIAERTGCRGFNALYGVREPGVSSSTQDDLALENLSYAVARFAPFGGTLFIEPLTRGLNGGYPLQSAAEAVEIVERVRDRTGLDNIGLLYDTFHLAGNGDDLHAVIVQSAALVARVQLADSPGRGEPGSGGIDFVSVLHALWTAGYRGGVAAEYVPTTERTADSLGWVDRMPRLFLHPPGGSAD